MPAQVDSEAPTALDFQLPLPLPGFIERPSTGVAIPRADRVFANRNLHMAEIEWVGFDMDYTLAIYRQAAMDALSVELTIERLIGRGYPARLRTLSFDTNFPIRGLLIDKKQGNVLKLDRHKHVAKGYHGTELLEKSAIDELYHEQKLRYQSSRYHWIDTLFALCEVTSYAAIISALEREGFAYDSEQLFADVRASIDQAHADGTVYAEVTAHLEKYILKDEELPHTLHKLRSAGKKLFLLTNSPWHYTETVMSYLLDSGGERYSHWRQYFDYVVCAAKKPTWFGQGTPFVERIFFESGETSTRAATILERGHVYEGGSLVEFEERLNLDGRKVLYVGDHIYGDILRSKKDSTWRTAFIIQELDQEISALKSTTELRTRRRQLAEARPLYEDELRYYSKKYKELTREKDQSESARAAWAVARGQVERLRKVLSDLELEYEDLNKKHDEAFHPYFGPLLKEMNGLSVFGQQVALYADIYMRRVSCLGAYSPTQFFRSPHDLMPHEI